MVRVVGLLVGGLVAGTWIGAYVTGYLGEQRRRRHARFDHRLPWEKEDES